MHSEHLDQPQDALALLAWDSRQPGGPAGLPDLAAAGGDCPAEAGAVGGAALARAYAVLLHEPHLDEPSLAARLRCSEAAASMTLQRLSELGLVHEFQARPRGRVAVSPIAAMQCLIAHEHELLLERERSLRQSAETFSSLLATYGGGATGARQLQFGEQVTGLPALRLQLAGLISRARHSVRAISISSSDPLTDDALSCAMHSARSGTSVTVQKIYPYAVLFDSGALENAQAVAQAGAEIRLLPRLPLALVVVDEETVVIPRTPAGQPDGGFVIGQESVVSAMLALFAKCWRQSQPLAGLETDELAPVERAVIRLLATGAKDDAIARQLGTSVRTVRRIVGHLMGRAGVSSRFAFGVWAAARTAEPDLKP